MTEKLVSTTEIVEEHGSFYWFEPDPALPSSSGGRAGFIPCSRERVKASL
jgi:hypothetical protein